MRKPKDSEFGHTYKYKCVHTGKTVYGYAPTDVLKYFTKWDESFLRKAAKEYIKAADWLNYKNKELKNENN